MRVTYGLLSTNRIILATNNISSCNLPGYWIPEHLELVLVWLTSPCFEGWLLTSSLLIQSGLDTCTEGKEYIWYLEGWCMIKLLKFKSSFTFLTRGLRQIFHSLWRGQYQWQNVLYFFLKLLLKTLPNPNFSPTWKLKVQTGYIPLSVLPFLHCQRFPFRRQIWGEPLITLAVLNSPLADKGIDQLQW